MKPFKYIKSLSCNRPCSSNSTDPGCRPDCCPCPGSCGCAPQCNCFPGRRDRFYAQFSVRANPPSNSDLPLAVLFQEGNKISLSGSTDIILPSGYLYLIDFLFLATPEANGYMQITPKINGTLHALYSFFAPTGAAERNTSASGSFTTNAAANGDAALAFQLAYPATTRNIDISGAVSVTPLFEI